MNATITWFGADSSAWLPDVVRAAWQSTVVLGLGLLAARVIPTRPARAHRLLLAAALACLVVPPASLAARRLDLGLLRAAAAPPRPGLPAGHVAARPGPDGRPTPGERDRSSHGTSPDVAPSIAANKPLASWSRDIGEVGTIIEPRRGGRLATSGWLIVGWAVAAVLGLARLGWSFVGAVRLKAGAEVVRDPSMIEAAGAAARALGLATVPEVRASRAVRCPMVWCWGRRPLLILPVGPGGATAGGAAILCHELAHWKRGDHLAALLGEVLTCLLPWQPLAWAVRGRMADLAELACDDWALAHAGPVEPGAYAEALLGLARGPHRPLVPAAASRRSGLVARVRHILNDRPLPRPGRAWSLTLAVAAVGLVAVLALAQARRAGAVAVGLQAPPPQPDEPAGDLKTFEGVVRDEKGTPIAGADVLLAEVKPPKLAYVAIPPDDPRSGGPAIQTLARGQTDAAGRFSFRARVETPTAQDRGGPTLLASKPGYAPASVEVDTREARPIEVALAPAVPIVGHLLTPAGEPASGVAIKLMWYSNGEYEDRRKLRMMTFERQSYSSAQEWDERPACFPGDIRTDAAGRFVIDGLVPAGMFATIETSHPDFAAEELTVTTGDPGATKPGLEAFSIRPLPREFTHTLGPARPVVGRVTDAETKQPLAGVTVEVIPMRQHGGMQRRTRTDAHGRYRVADREGRSYFVAAIPASGTGYLKNEQNDLKWPAGASELVVDLPLRRGIAIRGRVVDEETGRPVAGAGVAYQPKRANKNVRGDDDFRSPAPTDGDGRFAVTGVRGEGVVVAEGPSPDYIRHPVDPVDFGMERNMQVHGLARFEVPAEGDAPEVVIKLKKGFTLQARAVDPAGKPLHVRAWCPELKARFLNNWMQPEDFPDGVFRLPGAEPGRTYRVYLWGRDGKFARAAEVVADPNRPGPVEVRLEPTARIKGRVVDPAGAPVEGSQVLLNVQLVDTGKELKEADRFDQSRLCLQLNFSGEFIKPTYPADFDHPSLFPGLRYFVTWYTPGGKSEWHAIEPLAPGEVRDLGDIRSDRKEGKDAQ